MKRATGKRYSKVSKWKKKLRAKRARTAFLSGRSFSNNAKPKRTKGVCMETDKSRVQPPKQAQRDRELKNSDEGSDQASSRGEKSPTYLEKKKTTEHGEKKGWRVFDERKRPGPFRGVTELGHVLTYTNLKKPSGYPKKKMTLGPLRFTGARGDAWGVRIRGP